jgi:hypothetical protein
VVDAFCVLEIAKSQSREAANLLDSLNLLLWKHKIPLPDVRSVKDAGSGWREGQMSGGDDCVNYVEKALELRSPYVDEPETGLRNLIDFDEYQFNDFLDGLNSFF